MERWRKGFADFVQGKWRIKSKGKQPPINAKIFSIPLGYRWKIAVLLRYQLDSGELSFAASGFNPETY